MVHWGILHELTNKQQEYQPSLVSLENSEFAASCLLVEGAKFESNVLAIFEVGQHSTVIWATTNWATFSVK